MSGNNLHVFSSTIAFSVYNFWLPQPSRFWSTNEIISGKVLKFGNVLNSPVWLKWPPSYTIEHFHVDQFFFKLLHVKSSIKMIHFIVR